MVDEATSVTAIKVSQHFFFMIVALQYAVSVI